MLGNDLNWRGLSKVAPYLYVGSFPPADRYDGATAIVFCAQERQPSAHDYPGIRVIHAGIDDTAKRALTAAEITKVQGAAAFVASCMRLHQRVMVTCAMGMNRSGLVAALALRKVYDMSADEAIKAVRAARGPFALSNPQFEAYIRMS